MTKPETGTYKDLVDRGLAHDKVRAGDPATAPLQTDAESGGRPTSKAALDAVAHEQASRDIPEDVGATTAVPGRAQGQIPSRSMAIWLAVGIILLAAAGLALALV